MVALSKKPVNVPLLELPTDCVIGRFCRRLKRFSVEIELNGQKIWAHCNNTGSMLGLLRPGIKALISPAKNPRRKLAWTLEMLQLPGGKSGSFWAGVNTLLPNRMLEAAFHAGLLDFAKDYSTMRPEAACGESRLDALFMGDGKPHLWVECKNVSMVEDEVAAFPDAQSERARKHLRGLMDIVAGGGRAAMFYLIQRPDAKCFGPADFIDPEYAELFYRAMEAGVEVYAHRAILCPHGASLGPRLPLTWLNITGKISIQEN